MMASTRDPPPAHRGKRLAGLLLLVSVLVAVMVIAPRLNPSPDRSIERPEPPPPLPGPELVARAGSVIDVDFAADGHGFALWGRCTRPLDNERCGPRLLVTEDGDHWQVRKFPLLSAIEVRSHHYRRQLVALGGCTVVVGPVNGHRMISHDCGRRWHVVLPTVRRTLERIPKGAILERSCAEPATTPSSCRDSRVVVIPPDSGRPALLATEPAVDDPAPEPVPTHDGRWWVTGRDLATGRPAVAVSEDGRSWSVSTVPFDGGPIDRVMLASRNGHAYAVLVDRYSGGAGTLVGIFHRENGSRWEQVSDTTTSAAPSSVTGVPILAPRDVVSLVDAEDGVGYRSDDHGRTFEAVVGKSVISPRWTRGGYVARSAEEPGRWFLATDGVRWRPIDFPHP